jgi:hypothetical protein
MTAALMGRLHADRTAPWDIQQLAARTAAEYESVVTAGVHAHDRSAQKLIGPSEIGVPCDRALLHKLAQQQEPRQGVPWKPAVGTALHNQMETWFSCPAPAASTTAGDWEVEQKILVGRIGPDFIRGSTDLYRRTGVILDHKFVGKERLKKYRAKGPGPQYRKQAHTYGKGWEDEGWPVLAVMICFVPRDGELRDSYYWWEPYDRQVAEDALARANNRYTLLTTLGLETALSLFPLCDEDTNDDWEWCRWCNPLRGPVVNAHPFALKK